jgi:hypothetical protein
MKLTTLLNSKTAPALLGSPLLLALSTSGAYANSIFPPLPASTTTPVATPSITSSTTPTSPTPPTAPVANSSPHLEPIRQGTLHYYITESSTTRGPDGRSFVGNSYQEVCKGEVNVPVLDMTSSHGTSYTPEHFKCPIQTAEGPVDIDISSNVVLRNTTELADKAMETTKALELTFSVAQKNTEGDASSNGNSNASDVKTVSYNHFQTHTRDLSQRSMNLQAQLEPIRTKVGDKEVTETFFIRTEFVDQSL